MATLSELAKAAFAILATSFSGLEAKVAELPSSDKVLRVVTPDSKPLGALTAEAGQATLLAHKTNTGSGKSIALETDCKERIVAV